MNDASKRNAGRMLPCMHMYLTTYKTSLQSRRIYQIISKIVLLSGSTISSISYLIHTRALSPPPNTHSHTHTHTHTHTRTHAHRQTHTRTHTRLVCVSVCVYVCMCVCVCVSVCVCSACSSSTCSSNASSRSYCSSCMSMSQR